MLPVLLHLLAASTFFLLHTSFPSGAGSAPSPELLARRRYRAQETKWIIGILLGVGIVFVVAVMSLIGNTQVSRLALRQARANPTVVERLGQPIRKGRLVTGNISVSGSSGHADFAVPLYGPKGKGMLYAVANKNAGLWRFETLRVVVDGDEQPIDLLHEGEQSPPQPQ
jgi:hypothetical protein